MKTKPLSHRVSLETCTPRVIALSLLAILLALALTGCKSAPTAADGIDSTKVYSLVSVDGQNVPCRVKHGGGTMNITSGSFSITSDGRCRSVINFAVPPHPDVSHEVKASYTQTGTELTMQWEGAGITKGQLKGKHFTMTNEGMIFAYRKQ